MFASIHDHPIAWIYWAGYVIALIWVLMIFSRNEPFRARLREQPFNLEVIIMLAIPFMSLLAIALIVIAVIQEMLGKTLDE